MKHTNVLYDTALILQQVVHLITLEAEFDVRSGLVRWAGDVPYFLAIVVDFCGAG